MSGFKRGQSRVFWNQMATQDFGNSNFAYPESPLRSPRLPNLPKTPSTSKSPKTPRTQNFRLESPCVENSGSFNEEDTTDASNVTVIRVEHCISNRSQASGKFEG